MEGANTTTHAAAQLDAGAHAMRNDVSTLRLAAGLVDDPDVAESIGAAVADLQVRLERAVVAARIDLERAPAAATLAADELLRLATARARREGLDASAAPTVRIVPEQVTAPGPWIERLACDLLHDADPDWIDVLADACGARVERDGDAVVLHVG